MYIDTVTLPDVLRQALKHVSYNKPNVKVQSREKFIPSEGTASFTGNRGYVVVVSLLDATFQVHQGAWVDDDHNAQAIPLGGAVIVGEHGGRGSFAQILVHPENLILALPAQEGMPDEQRQALRIVKGIKPGYRKSEFARKELGDYSADNPIIQALAEKGMVKIDARGAIKITTDGKNALE